MIFYLDNSRRLFVHVGTFPFPKQFQLLLKYEYFLQTTIKLRFRRLSSILTHQNQKSSKTSSKPTRKQKTINQVTELVSLWRKYFEMTDENGKKLYTLEQAAEKLGIHKKTLDDYYYKLKAALGMGFDVEKHKHEKIGVLRKFVKENKKKGVYQLQASLPTLSSQSQPWGFMLLPTTPTQQFSLTTTTSYVASSQSFSPKSNNPPLPQKPPEDQIDKYFVKYSDQSSSESEQSE